MNNGDRIEYATLSGKVLAATVLAVRDGSWVVFADGVRGCDVRRVRSVNGSPVAHAHVTGAEYMAAWAAEEV